MQNRRFILSRAAATIALLFVAFSCGVHAQGASAETVWPMPDWQTSTPEAEGMDSAALAKLIAFGKTKSFDSFLIVRHGRIVLDAYYAPYSADVPHVINSATKAVVSSLIAMVHKDGLLDGFDHPVLDFFAGRDVANIDERKKAMTVQNLLDMTSGLDWDEGFQGGKQQSLIELGRSADWVKFILDRPMAHAPGEVFYYDSGNSHLLSAIILKLTGSRAEDFANARLFGPLGIAPPFWRRDAQGISIGGWGLSLLPHDMARIGYLYLHRGEWSGKQLLPTGWVDAIDHPTVSMNASFDPGLKYSNQFWVLPDRHVYMAVGYHCQVIMILPDQNVVAAMTARDFCPFRRLADDITAAVKSASSLPPNPEAAKLLADEVADVATEKATDVGPTPDLAAVISGKTYRFPDNALNVKTLALFLTDSQPRYEVDIDTHQLGNALVKLGGPIGLDGLYRKSKPTAFGLRAVKGAWQDGETFAVDVQYVGLGEQAKFVLRFDGDKVTLRGKARDGHEVVAEGAADR